MHAPAPAHALPILGKNVVRDQQPIERRGDEAREPRTRPGFVLQLCSYQLTAANFASGNASDRNLPNTNVYRFDERVRNHQHVPCVVPQATILFRYHRRTIVLNSK